MKKWVDRFVGILFISACSLYFLVVLLYLGKQNDDYNITINTMVLLAIVALPVGVLWLQGSFRRRKNEAAEGFDTDSPDASTRFKLSSWVYVGCVLIIALQVLFVARAFEFAYYLQNMEGPMFGSVLSIAIVLLCFLTRALFYRKKVAAIIRGAFIGMACVLTAYTCFVYFNYLPQYSKEDAYNIVKKDTRFDSAIYSQINFDMEDNPFVQYGYLFWYPSDKEQIRLDYFTGIPDKDSGFIVFNLTTGKYEYYHLVPIDKATEYYMSSNKLHFTSDKTAQIHLSLNTESNYSLVNKNSTRIMLSIQEDDARNFIHELGDEELEKHLEEIVPAFLKHYDVTKAEWMAPAAELMITIKLYNIEIATCHKGNITLNDDNTKGD